MYMQNRRVQMGVIENFTTSKTCDYCFQIASVVNNYGDHFCELKNKRIVQNDREVVDTHGDLVFLTGMLHLIGIHKRGPLPSRFTHWKFYYFLLSFHLHLLVGGI